MVGVDELFKKPNLPGQKRKLDPRQDPNEIYKQAKLSGSASVQHHQSATVQDGEEDDDAAGPELPPDFDEGGDEEGRFFGGGISKDTAEVMDFIDERDKEGQQKTEKIDTAWVRKLALNFEKRITKNAELRARFEGDPQKFMASEADLDADIKTLSVLSEHPNLYQEFARLGCVSSLVSLLAHENTDIAIDAIEIISELIDEDVEAEEKQWDSVVDAMLEADLLDLLFQNISRLNESSESDKAGVYHILEVLEALSSRATVAASIGKNSSLMSWLLSRAMQKEAVVTQNKQYSAEVLAILLQSFEANVKHFIELNGIDVSLQALSAYRKRDPAKGTEEEEFVENVFDCVTCAIDDTVGKGKFFHAEGVELCLIMLKEGKMSRPRALRLLDHALSGPSGAGCAEKLVDAAGLKQVFSLFMKKQDGESIEHLLGILASMLRSLPAESAHRIRLLSKFVEKDYEKLERLARLRREYSSRVAVVDGELKRESLQVQPSERDEFENESLSRRLDAGLFSLQTIDLVLSWLIAEDDGANFKVRELLADRDESIETLRQSLQEQLNGITLETADPTRQDMLLTLLKFLV